nr:MAG TPA: hypothetical protein [Caudoviricetes sp.]
MEEMTYDEMRMAAKTGDILIGKFTCDPFLNVRMPILLIGDCVGCVIDKPDVEAGAAYYLKQQGDIYVKYRIVRTAKDGSK